MVSRRPAPLNWASHELPVQAGPQGLPDVRHYPDDRRSGVTDKRRGAIGVDLNADHLAIAETDASGNYVDAFSVPPVDPR